MPCGDDQLVSTLAFHLWLQYIYSLFDLPRYSAIPQITRNSETMVGYHYHSPCAMFRRLWEFLSSMLLEGDFGDSEQILISSDLTCYLLSREHSGPLQDLYLSFLDVELVHNSVFLGVHRAPSSCVSYCASGRQMINLALITSANGMYYFLCEEFVLISGED